MGFCFGECILCWTEYSSSSSNGDSKRICFGCFQQFFEEHGGLSDKVSKSCITFYGDGVCCRCNSHEKLCLEMHVCDYHSNEE